MIKRELTVFLIVGTLTVMVDFLVYLGLVSAFGMGIDAAKATGFIAGTVFAYFANRFWTFAHAEPRSGSVWRFAALYALTLGANVIVNAAMLALLRNTGVALQAAFVVATGVSASLNFIGMKIFVFRAHTVPESS